MVKRRHHEMDHVIAKGSGVSDILSTQLPAAQAMLAQKLPETTAKLSGLAAALPESLRHAAMAAMGSLEDSALAKIDQLESGVESKLHLPTGTFDHLQEGAEIYGRYRKTKKAKAKVKTFANDLLTQAHAAGKQCNNFMGTDAQGNFKYKSIKGLHGLSCREKKMKEIQYESGKKHNLAELAQKNGLSDAEIRTILRWQKGGNVGGAEGGSFVEDLTHLLTGGHIDTTKALLHGKDPVKDAQGGSIVGDMGRMLGEFPDSIREVFGSAGQQLHDVVYHGGREGHAEGRLGDVLDSVAQSDGLQMAGALVKPGLVAVGMMGGIPPPATLAAIAAVDMATPAVSAGLEGYKDWRGLDGSAKGFSDESVQGMMAAAAGQMEGVDNVYIQGLGKAMKDPTQVRQIANEMAANELAATDNVFAQRMATALANNETRGDVAQELLAELKREGVQALTAAEREFLEERQEVIDETYNVDDSMDENGFETHMDPVTMRTYEFNPYTLESFWN